MHKYALLVARLNNTSPTFQAIQDNVESFVENNTSKNIAANLALSHIEKNTMLFFEMLSPIKPNSKELLLEIMAVGVVAVPSTAEVYTDRSLSKTIVYTTVTYVNPTHTVNHVMFMWVTDEKEDCHEIIEDIRKVVEHKDIYILRNEFDISNLINPYTIAENTNG